MESVCSGNDGAGKLFWGIKTIVSWWQLSFLVILSVNANANMPPLRDEMKGRC